MNLHLKMRRLKSNENNGAPRMTREVLLGENDIQIDDNVRRGRGYMLD